MAAVQIDDRKRRSAAILQKVMDDAGADSVISPAMLKAMRNRKLIPNNTAVTVVQARYRR